MRQITTTRMTALNFKALCDIIDLGETSREVCSALLANEHTLSKVAGDYEEFRQSVQDRIFKGQDEELAEVVRLREAGDTEGLQEHARFLELEGCLRSACIARLNEPFAIDVEPLPMYDFVALIKDKVKTPEGEAVTITLGDLRDYMDYLK